MNVRLAFDKQGAVIALPNDLDATVLEPRYAAELTAADAALAAAVASPIGCPPLAELARGKRSAAIAVCDITRPAPNKLTLPHILRALEAGGIPPRNVTILIATGLHREATDRELDEIVGANILSRCKVDSHRAKEIDEQTFLGETAGGAQAFVDSRFVEADLRITLGFIEPHLMAGFSGGRKLIAIGLAGERTIKRLHSPLYMRDEKVGEGSFPDNPLHRELLEIAEMAGHDFMLDVALTRTRGIAAVFAGNPVAAHAQGVKFVRESTLAEIAEPADAVITTSGGYPLDLTFYQAVKGITGGGARRQARRRDSGHGRLPRRAGQSGVQPADAQCGRCVPAARRIGPAAGRGRSVAGRKTGHRRAQGAAVVLRAGSRRRRPGAALGAGFRRGPAFDDPQQSVDDLLGASARRRPAHRDPEGPYVFSQPAGRAAGRGVRAVVDGMGLEPTTSALRTRRSPN